MYLTVGARSPNQFFHSVSRFRRRLAALISVFYFYVNAFLKYSAMFTQISDERTFLFRVVFLFLPPLILCSLCVSTRSNIGNCAKPTSIFFQFFFVLPSSVIIVSTLIIRCLSTTRKGKEIWLVFLVFLSIVSSSRSCLTDCHSVEDHGSN